MIPSSNIKLGSITKNQYLSVYDLIYSPETLKYDPDRPIRTLHEEEQFWINQIESKHSFIYGIFFESDLVGLVYAFSFNQANKSCEIGCNILQKENYRKGFAFAGLSLLMKKLTNDINITRYYAEINEQNHPSVNLFTKLGFIQEAAYIDGQVNWIVYSKIDI